MSPSQAIVTEKVPGCWRFLADFLSPGLAHSTAPARYNSDGFDFMAREKESSGGFMFEKLREIKLYYKCEKNFFREISSKSQVPKITDFQ